MSQKNDFSVTNDVLQVGKDVKVKFKWPVAEVLDFEEILVVRVEPDIGSGFNENVFGVQRDGSLAWGIEPRKHVYDDSPYTSILAKGDKVRLLNWAVMTCW